MTREPDRFEAKAAEVGRQIDGSPWPDIVAIIAAALRQAADEALEKAAVAFAEAPTTQHSGAAVASVLRYLARDSAPQPAAAPAAEPCCAGASSGGLGHSLDCPRFPLAAPDKHEDWCALFGNPEAGKSCDCQPGAPSLLPRVLAALEGGAIDATAGGHTERAQERRALAAELRHYIAEMEAGHVPRLIADLVLDALERCEGSREGPEHHPPMLCVACAGDAARAARTAARSEGET